MTIQTRAQKYFDQFETIKTYDEADKVILKDSASKALRDSIYDAHEGKSPNDFVFATHRDLLGKIAEYSFDSLEALEDRRSEIVDSSVDVYTYNLTRWLAEDIRNVSYISHALQELGNFDDGFALLASAQYMAIDEVMEHVIALLSK